MKTFSLLSHLFITIIVSMSLSSYAQEQNKEGKSTLSCGDALFDSRDNQSYSTILLGSQCWMAENLNIGTLINGTTDQSDNSTIEKYCFDNNSTNCDTYGGLYQWDEAMQYITTAGTQGICPSGWHLPTDNEYKALEMFLGMTQAQADGTGDRGTDEGSKLAGNESLWVNGNLDQNANFGTSGFNALPGGYRKTDGLFYYIDRNLYFWTSNENGINAWHRFLYSYSSKVVRNSLNKMYGVRVRCIQDASASNQAPEASGVDFNGLLNIGETLNGSYTYSDNESDPEGTSLFQWYRADDASGTNQKAISGATSQAYTIQTADEGKYIAFEVTPIASSGTNPGIAVISSFQGDITYVPCSNTFVDSRNGQTYTTVQIGTQCWMAENLNIGTMITTNSNQSNNSTIEKYCYDNNTNNCDTYGGLYQWDEMMQYVTASGTQGVCPSGWHIPTDEEWKTLEIELGMSSSNANNTDWRGTNEGSKLANNGTLWTNGSLDQNTNFGTSGFNAIPAGYRLWNGSTYDLSTRAYFWTSYENGSNAESRRLSYDYSQVYRHEMVKSSGYSVRCVHITSILNIAPEASGVGFNGTLKVGDTLSGSYTYSDNESDPEGTSLYQWYRADDVSGTNQTTISGATSITYTLQVADEGKYIAFEVTPVATSGTSLGTAVMSSYQGAVSTNIFSCGDALIDSRDSQSYATVQIGTQCWMAENLNIGTIINSSSSSDNQTDNGIIEKYCYDNNVSNCTTYGGLYQWDEAMQYVTTAGTQGICPTGWHFPADYEYKTLEMQLGMSSSEANSTGWRGTDEGSKLAGNEPLWINGNLDENVNFGTSGFTGLPAGYRYTDGSFIALTGDANFWSSSRYGSNPWKHSVYYIFTKVYRGYYDKAYGFSVRCLRDEASSNQAPEASDVGFNGTLKVGDSLTGAYTYSDNEADPEGTSTFVWYRADDISGTNQTAISGASSTTYTLQVADEGKYIAFEVTPVATSGTSPGTAVMSSYQGAVTDPNKAPLIDTIADISLAEDFNQYLINISGIEDGDSLLIQNITLEATSSDTSIISDPTITYTPNETTGTLTIFSKLNVNGTAIITVKVKDDGGTANGGVDSTLISFEVEITPINDAPIANAGIDQTQDAGTLVSLDGSSSYDIDIDPITYHWSSPSTISLSDSTLVNPEFTAPHSCSITEYLFTLIVNDGEYNSSADSIVVTVNPDPPHAEYYPNAYYDTLFVGEQVQRTLTLKNTGLCDLTGNVQTNNSWIGGLPISGVIPPTDSAILNITFNATNLTSGEYQGTISLTSNDPVLPVANISVYLKVRDELSVSAEATPNRTCSGNEVQLIANAIGGYESYTYTWTSNPVGFSSNNQNASVNPLISTSYYLEVSDGHETVYDTVELFVYPNELPSTILNLSPVDGTYNVTSPIQFAWDTTTNTTDYDLYIWRTSQQKPILPTIDSITEITYSYNEYLNKNYLYNWQLTANNTCYGNESESDTLVFSFNNFPDLTVSELNIPDTAYAGSELEVIFDISNIGMFQSGWNSWKDEIYLSPTPEFDIATAVKLQTIENKSQLNIGESYTDTTTILLDIYLEGTFYVFVKTDGENVIQETNEENNLLSSLDKLTILLPPYPDIEVNNILGLSTTIIPDSAFTLGWIVENIGDANAIGGWSQKISMLSGQERITLGYVQYTDSLAASASIAQSATFTIPKTLGLEGYTHLEVELSPYTGLIEEPNATQNNLAISIDSTLIRNKLFISTNQQTIEENSNTPLHCSIFRSGKINQNLIINLSISENNRLGAPSSITIPSGQSGATFNITSIDNSLIEGDVEVSIFGSTNNYLTTSSDILILDDEIPSLYIDSNTDTIHESDTLALTISRNLTIDSTRVYLMASKTSQLDLPNFIVFNTGVSSINISIPVIDDEIPELTQNFTISTSAAGYSPDMDTLTIIDNDLPAVQLTFNPDTVSEGGGPYASWGTVQRVDSSTNKITIQLTSNPSGDLYFPSQVIIPQGQNEKTFNIGVIDNSVLDGDRTVEVTAAIYLSSCGCNAPPESGGTTTSTLTIIDNDGPALNVTVNPFTVPEGISNAGILTISRNTLGGDEVTINIQHSDSAEIILPTTIIIPAGIDEIEVPFSTIDDGIEDGNQIVTINVSSPTYASGSCWVMVSDLNLPDFVATELFLSSNTALVNEEVQFNMYLKNDGNALAIYGASVKVYQSEDQTLDGNDKLLTTLTTLEPISMGDSIQINGSFTISDKVGNLYIIAVVNEEEQLNELLSINNTTTASSLIISPDYTISVTVDDDIFNGDSPIIINGLTETLSKSPAPNKDVDVYVIVNGARRVFQATSDANGEFSVSFIPINGEAGEFTVGACFPNEGATNTQDDFTILGAKRTSNDYVIWDIWQNQTESKTLEIRNLSGISLDNVRLEVVSGYAGLTFNNTPIPNLGANSTANLNYTVECSEITEGSQYQEVQMALISDENTEYTFSAWLYCRATKGNLLIDPPTLSNTMVKNQINHVEFTITNNGMDSTGAISVNLPAIEWMSLTSLDTTTSLQPNESAVVTLTLIPGDDLQLNNPISGQMVLEGTNTNSVALPFSFEPISNETGDLLVDVVDEYTYNTAESPHVDSATVILKHPYTGEIIAQGLSDANGHFLAQGINEGYYILQVEANKHSGYQDYVYIDKGITNQEVVFIAFQAITYTWNVEPTEIEDQYEVSLVTEFETNVPAPVVLMEMPDTMPHLEVGEVFPFLITLTNEGLITAEEVEIELPEDEEYQFTINAINFDLLANQSVQIPVLMERKTGKGSEENLNCTDFFIAKYQFICGPDDQYRFAVKNIYYKGRTCPSDPSAPNGGGGILPNPTFPSNGIEDFVSYSDPLPPFQSLNEGCDTCIARFGDKLICFSPVPPIGLGFSKISFGKVLGIGIIAKKVLKKLYCLYKLIPTLNCFIKQGSNKFSSPPKITEMEQIKEDILIVKKGLLALDSIVYQIYQDTNFVDKQDIEMFHDSISTNLNSLLSIDEVRKNELLNSFSTSDISASEIENFVDHWNSTIEAWNNGIVSPTPEYPDIADSIKIHNYKLELDSCFTYANNRGYQTLESLYNADIVLFKSYFEEKSSSVCATVTVEFSQTLTMTREAFEGTLTIFNGHETDAMENISLDLIVKDENGNIRNDLFQINTKSLDQISAIDGSGILNALASGTAVITFIPEVGAAPEVPISYSFGGTLSYLDPFTGEMYEQPLFPVTLEVSPSPYLYLDYFMQRSIFGDDALTEAVEPMIPAELAVMINNQGAGMAKNLSLESAQPEIIDNDKGLLIDFNIIGSNLGGQAAQLGLYNVDFGNLDGGDIAIGQWWFTSSLLGHFISYEASVKHADSYGNPDLSLVGGVEIHELIKSISVYGSLDDSINDFLVNEIPDIEDIPDILYYSNGITAPVSLAANSSTDGIVTLTDTTVVLSMTPSAIGWNYTMLNDPGDGKYKIVSVIRNDGQAIPLDNIWLTYSTIPDTGEPIYENKMHFIDTLATMNTAAYNIVFEPIDQDVPEVVTINGVPNGVIDIGLESLEVVFSEVIDTTTFTYEDMTLKCQGGANLMDSLVGISRLNDTTFVIDISSKTNASGYYTFTVQTANISDLVGNMGVEGKQVAWTQAFNIPAIDNFIGIPENNINPIDTLLIVFNMPIIESTFTTNQLLLHLVDGDTLSTNNILIESINTYGNLFKLSGLQNTTNNDGYYELAVKVSEITGENGEIGLIDQSVQWEVCQAQTPTVYAGDNDTICQSQSYQLMGSVENAASFYWSSLGSGSFDNNQSLTPIYTPSLSDIENGTVDINLTAIPMGNCAPEQTATMQLYIYKYPIAIAGQDLCILAGDSCLISNAFAANNISLQWRTNGTGSFDNPQTLNPTYFPGTGETGDVNLTLAAIGYGVCDTSFSTVTLSIKNSIDIDLHLKVFLEGPFNGTEMSATLMTENLISNSQPFNISPWFYMGTEHIEANSNPDIVDWVLIELRKIHYQNGKTISKVIGRKAALVTKSGIIINENNSDTMTISVPDCINDDLFAVIYHRNHIPIMSSTSLPENNELFTYDFSTGTDKIYGGNIGCKQLNVDIWGMSAADGNADGQVNIEDIINVWNNQAGEHGYQSGDFNLNGEVNNPDKNNLWIPNNGIKTQVPE